MSNCSVLFRIYLSPLWIKSNTSSSCEGSLSINDFPQHLASSPKSSSWPHVLGLPHPWPHLLDASPTSSPWASLLLLEHIKPVPTPGPFLWLLLLSQILYFHAGTWLIHSSLCSPLLRDLPRPLHLKHQLAPNTHVILSLAPNFYFYSQHFTTGI